MLTIADALAHAERSISRIDAVYLLCHTLSVGKAFIMAHGEQPLTSMEASSFNSLVGSRGMGIPVAYLTGKREFYGRDFIVDKRVLIPRPETELLVESALHRLPQHKAARVLDLGTGSGAIAITLALEQPTAHVVAVDASIDALAVAHENMLALVAEPDRARLSLLHGRWFEPVAGQRFDLIVSNPPYVAENDPHLGQGDLRFEPDIALASGPDGLSALKHIIENAPDHLKLNGWLMVEHGYDQGPAVFALLQARGFADCATLKDLAGLDRVGIGSWAVAA